MNIEVDIIQTLRHVLEEIGNFFALWEFSAVRECVIQGLPSLPMLGLVLFKYNHNTQSEKLYIKLIVAF